MAPERVSVWPGFLKRLENLLLVLVTLQGWLCRGHGHHLVRMHVNESRSLEMGARRSPIDGQSRNVVDLIGNR